MLNSYILFEKEHSEHTISYRNFRLTLIKRVLKNHHKPGQQCLWSRPWSDDVTPPPLHLTGRHFPKSITTNIKEKKPNWSLQLLLLTQRRGWQDGKICREWQYFSVECDVPLSVVLCFEIFPCKKNYRILIIIYISVTLDLEASSV